MQQSLFEVSVTANPAELPDSIEVDVANLQVDETITIADIIVHLPLIMMKRKSLPPSFLLNRKRKLAAVNNKRRAP